MIEEDRDCWQTPQGLWDELNKQYNFTFDCCALDTNKKCEKYSSDFESVTLKELKDEICWMNPPFSKPRDMFKHYFDVVENGVAIYRSDNLETRVWQEDIFPNIDWIFLYYNRILYEGFQGDKVDSHQHWLV